MHRYDPAQLELPLEVTQAERDLVEIHARAVAAGLAPPVPRHTDAVELRRVLVAALRPQGGWYVVGAIGPRRSVLIGVGSPDVVDLRLALEERQREQRESSDRERSVLA